jgi:hypothetical protein
VAGVYWGISRCSTTFEVRTRKSMYGVCLVNAIESDYELL